MNEKGWKSDDVKRHRRLISKECRGYVREIIPEIYIYRNKVAGHFAITDPYNEDNLATLEFSIMPHLSYHRPHWYVGAYQLSRQGQLSNIPKWSLTKEFEKMSKRFFPHLILKHL